MIDGGIMNKLEIEFFEEYKVVDNICKDMFESQQGVTEYIHEMESMEHLGIRQVPMWREKYKMLKHLRWLRNQIAHDSTAPELEERDLIELQNFHKQILELLDPLAVLKQPSYVERNVADYNLEQYDEESVPFGLIVGVITFAIIVAVMYAYIVIR